MGGMMSQNILNLVDIGMVGRLGDNALAGGLILSLIIGLPLCIILIMVAPAAFQFLTDDPGVKELGIPYLQVRIVSMIAVGMNFSFRGYWSAIHMTGVYLRTLLIMHAINIFLNWVLIFGNLGAPELGVFGAGLATTISLYIGTVLYFFFAIRHASDKGFLHRIPSRSTLWQQFRLSLPSSLQQLFFSAGLVTLIWIVGRIGTAEVAAVNVLMTFHITAILPAFGIALASTTLVGNALGRGDKKDAARWGWNGSALTFLYGIILSLLLITFADPILGVFLTNPETRQLAYLPMILWALMISFDTMGMVLMNALIGAGDTHRAMRISVTWQWVFFLPLAFLTGPVLGFGLVGVWVINGFYRVGQALNCAYQWNAGKWANIKI